MLHVKPGAVAAGIDRLVRRHELDVGAGAKLGVLLDRLADPAAPTTVHDPRRVLDVHLADSLVALDLPAVRTAGVVVDIGSGAGLPALPLAVALPVARIVAIESAGRKSAFIAAGVEAMELQNVDVAHVRAEEWTAGLGGCDVVCARALASLSVIAEYAAPLLRPGGTLVAWKGAVEADEARDGRAAAGMLGLEAAPPVAVTPYAGSDRRSLHVYTKVAETPPRYPRRAGMAVKRPLAAGKERRPQE